MKQILIIILIVAVGISFSGCKKAFTNPNTYTLKGKVYVDCNKTPIPNAIVIYVDNGIEGNGTGIHNGNLEVGRDTTNADGSFEINYKLPEGVGVLIEPNLAVIGVNKLRGVPDVQNLDNLEVFYNPQTNFTVNLSFQNPMTSNDTLYVTGLGYYPSMLKTIVGPFTNQTFTKQYITLDPKYYQTDSTGITYKFGINGKWNNSILYAAKPCESNTINLEIK